MRISSLSRKIVPASLLAVMLVVSISTLSYADADNVTVTTGIVDIHDGTVVVLIEQRDVVVPSNGAGLLASGQIAPGDVVDVKIVTDRGHKHKGHVTILK